MLKKISCVLALSTILVVAQTATAASLTVNAVYQDVFAHAQTYEEEPGDFDNHSDGSTNSLLPPVATLEASASASVYGDAYASAYQSVDYATSATSLELDVDCSGQTIGFIPAPNGGFAYGESSFLLDFTIDSLFKYTFQGMYLPNIDDESPLNWLRDRQGAVLEDDFNQGEIGSGVLLPGNYQIALNVVVGSYWWRL